LPFQQQGGPFNSSLVDCEKRIMSAVAVSERGIGQLSGWPGIWGSVLHARVIMNAGSMIKVVEAGTNGVPGAQLLDHFSVASIARTAMEAGVMMLYVTDSGADQDEFEMRRKVFLLHDTCHRSRIFKHGEERDKAIKDMRDMYRQKIAQLRADLTAMPMFMSHLRR
jgi:hypothetical protein